MTNSEGLRLDVDLQAIVTRLDSRTVGRIQMRHRSRHCSSVIAGMTLIVHPNTYHPAVGYMVLGDSVVVTKDGCEVLTGTPRELFSVAA